MFYSQFILAKKGPLGTIWIAAHLERKLRKNQVADTDIGVSVDSILFPEVPIALRLSSHLLLGVVRIYSRKVNYLFDDCSEALLKIKQAFRSTAVDLPPEESTAPYHSITLPETFDLDDFELPDNDIFQSNYVDQHVSTREQITLQDTMDGVVYSTSQFGLDERFGDGDASQIGLDLDEELLLDKVAAAGHGISGADPQGSVKPTTPWEQDNISERINEALETTTVNDSANQLERLGLNAESVEYAVAPSTPGLVQEPNLTSVQKALAGDDHLESDHNSNELMATESKVNVLSQPDFHHGDNHATDWPLHKDSNNETVQCMLLEQNGYHVRNADIKQANDSIKFMPLVSDNSEGTTDRLDGSNRLENMQNVPSMPSSESQGGKSDETAASPSCSRVTSDIQDPSHEMCIVKTNIHNDAEITDNVARSGSPVVINAEVHACQEPNDWETLHNHVTTKEMPCVGMNVLKPSSSHLSEPGMSSPRYGNSVAPNIQSVEVGSHSLETSKRNETSVEVQGEECHVIDVMQSEKSQTSGPGDIQADSRKLDEPLDNVISNDIHLQELNNSMTPNLSAPEKLLSAPEGLLDKPHDLLVDSTPENEGLAGSGGVDAGNKFIFGKKRSYTGSTVTVESLNSSESFEVDRSKKTAEFIPDDDDLLSSILVGRKSSVLKMKPTPPAPEVASRKRARPAPQASALKRKVLMDDTMVLHGDIIRQQLTNTEEIRRIRKKAPCTSPEILMIRIQFLEEEIFGEPIFTGMSAELTNLHCETYDLSKIRVSETDENHGSSEVAENAEYSVRPNAIDEGEKERSEEPVVLRDKGEAQPAEFPIQTGSQQVGDHHLVSLDTDTQGQTNSVTDVAKLKIVPNEPLTEVTEMEIDRGNGEAAVEATCSVVHGIETSQIDIYSLEICNLAAEDKTDSADALCLMREQKVDIQPVEEDASVANIVNSKVDQHIDDIAAVETEAEGRDGEERKVGPSVENGADARTDCTALTDNANTYEAASLETGGCNNRPSANSDNSKLGMNEAGVLAADLGCDGRDPSSIHMFGEEPVIDSKNSVELGVEMENASLDDGKNQVDSQSAMDVEITTVDHPAEDRGEFEEVTVGNDTEFLNVNDDEVAEDYDDGDGCAEETRLLENSGWSSRTRAVAKYLRTLFGGESVHGRKALALDRLLAGKTRKEASRMFFETLVLKTKDFIHVEQGKPLPPDNSITIKPRAKLMKPDF